MECIGVEYTNYALDARIVANLLADRGSVLLALADKGTRLNLAITLREHLHMPFGEPEGLGEDPHDCWALVSIVEHGAYWLNLRGYLAPNYIADKLDITVADGETVAEFLTRLYGVWYPSRAVN